MKQSRILALLGIVTWLSIVGSTNGMSTDVWTYYVNPNTAKDIAWQAGTVWCATDMGLYEWDTTDYTYRIHPMNEGLPYNAINMVEVSPTGTVWVGTGNGIARLNDGNWTSFTSFDGLPNWYKNVTALAPSATGEIYVLTSYYNGHHDEGGGISWSSGDEWQSAIHPTYTLGYDIDITSTGKAWFLAKHEQFSDYAVLSYDGSNWEVIEFTNERQQPLEFVIGSHDSFWIIVWDSDLRTHVVYKWSGTSWEKIATPFDEQSGPHHLETCVLGEVYCATASGGLARISGDEPSVIVESGDSNWMRSFTMDDAGTIWASTSTGGIARYSENSWSFYDIEAFPSGPFQSFEYDRNGTLYVTSAAGIIKLNNDTWESVCPIEEVPGTVFFDYWDIFFDQDNILWTAGHNGLLSFDGTLWTQYQMNVDGTIYSTCTEAVPAENGMLWTRWSDDNDLFLYDPVTSTGIKYTTPDEIVVAPRFLDKNGTVWCAYFQRDTRVSQFNNGEWHQDVLDGDEISGAFKDQDGNIWFSTMANYGSVHYPWNYESKIFKYEGSSYTEVFSAKSFTSLKMVDDNGGLWLSFYGYNDSQRVYFGIRHYDGETNQILNTTNGLLSNKVLDIIDAGDGSIWIATDKGICRYRSDLIPVGVEQSDDQPESFALITNYPNPFNPSTTIAYMLEQACTPELAIYSVTGQKIRSFHLGHQLSGQHSLVWDGKDDAGLAVSSGVYICRMIAGGIASSTTMTLMR